MHDRVARVHDIERDQPAQDRHGDDDIDVDCEQIRDELQKLDHCPPQLKCRGAGFTGVAAPEQAKAKLSLPRARAAPGAPSLTPQIGGPKWRPLAKTCAKWAGLLVRRGRSSVGRAPRSQ